MEQTITGTVGAVSGRTVKTSRGDATIFDVPIGSTKTSTFKVAVAEEARALQGSDVVATVDVSTKVKDAGSSDERTFTNYTLLSLKVISPAQQIGVTTNAVSTIPVTTAPNDSARQESIVRQSSIKAAFQYAAAAGLSRNEAFDLADDITAWVNGEPKPEMREPVAVGATESNDGVEW